VAKGLGRGRISSVRQSTQALLAGLIEDGRGGRQGKAEHDTDPIKNLVEERKIDAKPAGQARLRREKKRELPRRVLRKAKAVRVHGKLPS